MRFVDSIKALIKDNPRLLDMNIDSLVALKEVGITWETSGLTRRGLIHARRTAIDEYVKESYLIRVKFGFHEKTHDTLYKLAIEKGVTVAEIVRRALSLYDSCNRELKSKDKLVVTKEHLQC